MSLNPALSLRDRDPAAPHRLAWLLTACVILWPLWQGAGIQPGTLLDPANLQPMGQFLAAFLPPETGSEFLGYLGQATLETLAIATAGMTLAIVLAIPLGYLASGAGRLKPSLNPGTRALLTVLRGIPELVWALVFVRVFGLGPTAGVLALGLTYGGMLAKVYAEILESVPPQPARALLHTGARRPLALLYGAVPLAARELVSYTVYRWECAIRASVVMGFVGAGGLGQLMDQAMKMLNGSEAASILLAFVALVLAADLLSSLLRRWMDAAPAQRASPFGWRGASGMLLALAAVVASFRFLQLDFGLLLAETSLQSMGEFVLGFFPPALEREWLWKVLIASGETLAMSIMGTLFAAVLGLLLALPRWRAPWVLLSNLLRSVPELVWATLTALAAGLGAFAGTLALMLHTAGVFGRLYGEALQNTPPQPAMALQHSGAPRPLAFLYGTLPCVLPQLLAYTLYRWEMNVRMAAVLGFVGAGGLGQLLYVELSLFRHAEAATVIIAMLVLSVLVDWGSAWLRRRLAGY